MRQFLLFALMISTASAFFVRTLPQTPSTARSITRSSGRRSAVTVMKAGENESGYWQGEWVCADCGYIYDKDDFGGKYFEEQKFGFKCPQCSAPRKRFAKKVGDKIGVTRDGGDTFIILFSIIGGLGVIAFGIFAASQ